MFDSVRLPHRLDKQQFAALSEPLREKLLDAQFELAERKHKTVSAADQRLGRRRQGRGAQPPL